MCIVVSWAEEIVEAETVRWRIKKVEYVGLWGFWGMHKSNARKELRVPLLLKRLRVKECFGSGMLNKKFVIAQNQNFLWIFKLTKNQGLNTHYQATEFTEGYGSRVICYIKPALQLLWWWLLTELCKSELKKCLRNMLSLAVATFETRTKALSLIPYLFMVKSTQRNKEDQKSGWR